MSEPVRPSKRRLLTRRRFLKVVGGAALAGTATYGYGATIGVNALKLEQVNVAVPGLAPRLRNCRIVQLSDFHAGHTSDALIERSLAMALEQKPDYLVITGDLVDGLQSDLNALTKMLKPVADKVETLACLGNHDHAHVTDPAVLADKVSAAAARAGVRMLRDDVHMPRSGPGELCFVGLKDIWWGGPRGEVVSQAPADASVIVLSHNPDSYDIFYQYRWHLALSGHTHGGQVRIPFVGPIRVPVFHTDRNAGAYFLDADKPQRMLYVSRGVGHLWKIRLFCPPEVTCFTLRSA